MKPRTVILTLELPACEVPLAGFRKARCVGLWDEKRNPIYHVLDVAQATVSVAQSSRTPASKKGKRR